MSDELYNNERVLGAIERLENTHSPYNKALDAATQALQLSGGFAGLFRDRSDDAHTAVSAAYPHIAEEQDRLTRIAVEAELVRYIERRVAELRGSSGASELLDLADAIFTRRYREQLES